MNRYIIGFVGPSGSGKSTAAYRLMENWGFVRVHAGMGIKDAARLGFRLTYDQVDGPAINNPAPQLGGTTPRAFLEAFGKAAHEVAPAATAERLASDIAGLPSWHNKVVVDGIRKPQEATMVSKLTGTVIRIIRPDRPVNLDLPMDVMQQEIEADVTIFNSGNDGFAGLHGQIDKLAGAIRKSLGGAITLYA